MKTVVVKGWTVRYIAMEFTNKKFADFVKFAETVRHKRIFGKHDHMVMVFIENDFASKCNTQQLAYADKLLQHIKNDAGLVGYEKQYVSYADYDAMKKQFIAK